MVRAQVEALRSAATAWGRGGRALALGLALFMVACGILEPDVQMDGTVRFDPIEGGCWVIDTADATYDPVDLGEAFRVDGLRVHFEATIRTDLAHFCPGVIVDITSIEAID